MNWCRKSNVIPKRVQSLMSGLGLTLAVWLSIQVPAGAAFVIQPWTPLFEGIDFTTAEADPSEIRQQKIAALRVDLFDSNLEFFSTPSNGDADKETFGQTTTTFVTNYGVSVGVNANFFSPVSTTPNEPRDLSGLAISRGDIVSGADAGRPMMLITRSNAVSFASAAPAALSNYWTAVSGSDRIVRRGTNTVSHSCVTGFCGPNPRTAAGVSADGRYLYLLVIDGRQPGWSDGATLLETGDWLLRFGVWEGLNLDGGGSSAMAYLTNGNARLLNRPSGGVQRVNGNHLGVIAPPALPVVSLQPTNVLVNPTTRVVLRVRATGYAPLRYQWRLNGQPLSGATQSDYTIPAAGLSDEGVYTVVVTNLYGKITSSNAVLTLNTPPGNLVTAGDNSFGQLTFPSSATNLVAVAAGSWHSLVLSREGKVLAWGHNFNGQTTIPAGLEPAIAVAAGGYHSLGLSRSGRLFAWGANSYGQATIPPGLPRVWAIAAGTWHSLALGTDGRVYAWGDNTLGQTTLPAGLSNVVAIAAGGDHSLALRADGTVFAWGDNLDGQGNFAGESLVPFGLSNVVSLAAGQWHSLALRADGTVVGWGANDYGQASPPSGLTNVVGLSAGSRHSLALRRDGTLVSWGGNSQNQRNYFPSTNYVAIAAGYFHTLALMADGTPNLRLVQSSRSGEGFSTIVQTQLRDRYCLESTGVLPAPAWSRGLDHQGTGALLLLRDMGTNFSRFYRVRMTR